MQIVEMDRSDCSGCQACANACPSRAIEMEPDDKGFLYPMIDEESCVHCGGCDNVCPALPRIGVQAFAYIGADEEERKQSSSGGVFSALARYVLERGGVVFGAAFAEDWSVHHVAIEDVQELTRLRTSKYVQSNVGLVYRDVKQALSQGRWVLFSGTPCQVAGLMSYVHGEQERLLAVDFICHGVPAPAVWQAYIREQAKKGKITHINFRAANSFQPWELFALEVAYATSKAYSQDLRKDPYLKFFLSDIGLRDSCYSCHYREINRESDITMADFWGVDNVVQGFNDHKGTSLVILHSHKGKKIFTELPGRKQEVSCADAIGYNPAIVLSPLKVPVRNEFWEEFLANPDKCLKLMRKYTAVSWHDRVVRKSKKIIKKLLDI